MTTIRQARRAVRWDVVEYARARAALPHQQQHTVDAWTWLANYLTPATRDPDDPPEPPTLCRPDGTPLEEIDAMRRKPTTVVARPLPEGTLGELRAFVEATAELPDSAELRVVSRIGRGSVNGSQPRDIAAEVYPEPEVT